MTRFLLTEIHYRIMFKREILFSWLCCCLFNSLVDRFEYYSCPCNHESKNIISTYDYRRKWPRAERKIWYKIIYRVLNLFPFTFLKRIDFFWNILYTIEHPLCHASRGTLSHRPWLSWTNMAVVIGKFKGPKYPGY